MATLGILVVHLYWHRIFQSCEAIYTKMATASNIRSWIISQFPIPNWYIVTHRERGRERDWQVGKDGGGRRRDATEEYTNDVVSKEATVHEHSRSRNRRRRGTRHENELIHLFRFSFEYVEFYLLSFYSKNRIGHLLFPEIALGDLKRNCMIKHKNKIITKLVRKLESFYFTHYLIINNLFLQGIIKTFLQDSKTIFHHAQKLCHGEMQKICF